MTDNWMMTLLNEFSTNFDDLGLIFFVNDSTTKELRETTSISYNACGYNRAYEYLSSDDSVEGRPVNTQ